MTLCGAFLHPRTTPWFPAKGVLSRFTTTLAAEAADDPEAGRGGVTAQVGVAEDDAGAMDARIEQSPSPPLDVLHQNGDFA